VTQLLGPNPDLNKVTYLRTHLASALAAPRVVVIFVPGFLGSAATFAPLAEQLVRSMNGLTEVWSIDRRPNQLEDRLGANYAATGATQGNLAAVPQGMQFYFGDVDNPPLAGIGGAAGPEDKDLNTNGVIDGQFPLQDAFGVTRPWVKMSQDDMRYAAYWGVDTYARDWKVLVDVARAAVGPDGVVIFGGHSAGTGFAGIWAAYDFDPSSGVDAAYKKIDGVLLLEGGGPGAPSANRPSLASYLSQVSQLATPGGPAVYLQSFQGIDVPSLGAAASVQGVAAFYDPTSPALAQRTPVFGGFPITILLQAPLSNEAVIGGFIDDDFSAFGAFRASVGFSDDGPNQFIETPDADGFYFMGNATAGGVRQWKNIDDPSLPTCPPNVFTVSPGCPARNKGPQDTMPPLVWGQEKEVTDIKDLELVQFSNGNFAEWYYLAGRVSLDQQFGRDSSSLGDESLLAVTQNANMDRPVLAIGGSNGLAPLPSSWDSYFGSIATPAADKEIAIVEGYAHLDLLTAKNNEAVPIIQNWLVKQIVRNLP
jgi:pimeloyl-ACP methyl ester carboxylesterase